MRKQIFFILAACGAAVLLAGAVVFFQFKGNAVRAESELFVSAQADYGQLDDSLMPRIRHRAAFRFYARRIGLALGVAAQTERTGPGYGPAPVFLPL